MRSTKSLKTVATLGLACLSLASYAATGTGTFRNGQSYYGQSTSQAAGARVVDLASARPINVAHGETVTFQSGGKQFIWTFNGLGGRAVDMTRIAPASFSANRVSVYVGQDPLTRD